MARKAWPRTTPNIDLDTETVKRLIVPAFDGANVTAWQIAEGGLANTNVKVTLENPERTVLLRLSQRDPAQAYKEFELNRLVKAKVPVPEILYFAETDDLTDHPYMVMEWIDSPRLETVLEHATWGERQELAQSLGDCLAAIHSFEFDKCGFFDRTLSVPESLDMGADGLIGYAEDCLIAKGGSKRLGDALTKQLLAFLKKEGSVLSDWNGKPCLTHCDFGGTNILVDRDYSCWRVKAVLDWEFAMSATPFMDFGNLLRQPVGSEKFDALLASSYIAHGGTLPATWRKISLFTDLSAWCDFMTRDSISDELIADARDVIEGTMHNWQNS